MKKSKISLALVGAVLTLGISSSPAMATGQGDSAITIGDSTCDLGNAGIGDGSYDSPFLIGTAKQLAEINECTSSDYKYYLLTADIEITPSDSTDWNKASTGGWLPIGDSTAFSGYFNGQNHTISGLMIDRTDVEKVGLFAETNVAIIKNLHLTGSVTQGTDYYYAGALIGYASSTQIVNVTSDVDVTSVGDDVGGLVGYIDTGAFKDVTVNGDVTGNQFGEWQYNFGGVVGYDTYANIEHAVVNGDVRTLNEDPTNAGSVSKGEYVGGIAGQHFYANVINSEMNGAVDGAQYVAGIVGYGYCGLLAHDVMNGNMDLSNEVTLMNINYVGGIAGYWEEQSFTDVTMNGDITIHADDTNSNSGDQNVYYVGGIAGDFDYMGVIDSKMTGNIKVYADGTEGVEEIGGIYGYGTYVGLSDTSNSGDINVENGDYIGGIAGYASGGTSFIRASNSGAVTVDNVANTSDVDLGGIAGYVEDGVAISSSSNKGSITATGDSTDHVGGIIGHSDNAVSISDSYNRGNISGHNIVGGLVGYSESVDLGITTSYTTGTVTVDQSNTDVDVLVASGWSEPGTSSSVTFDQQASEEGTSNTGVIGHSTVDMKKQSTFADLGWSIGSDTSVWAIDSTKNDGYPYIAAVATSASGGGGGTSASATRDLLGPIAFKKGSAKLTAKAKLKLAIVASALKAGGYDKVTVKSYTKSTNTKLAVKRNKAVVKWLRAHGVKVTLYKEAVTRASTKKNNKIWVVAVKNATT